MARRFECEAVLFDLDGVLVDSTACVERHWSAWAERHELDTGRVLEIAHGRRTVDAIRVLTPHLSAEYEAEALERGEAMDTEGVLPVPGAADLLGSLPPGSWAVVTSGTRGVATSRLRHTGLIIPGVLLCAEDVSNGKPDPEGYLRVAGLLDAEPGACVVVEDTPAGIEAARGAGMRAVAVATTYPADSLTEADAIVRSLRNVILLDTHPSRNTKARLRLEIGGS